MAIERAASCVVGGVSGLGGDDEVAEWSWPVFKLPARTNVDGTSLAPACGVVDSWNMYVAEWFFSPSTRALANESDAWPSWIINC